MSSASTLPRLLYIGDVPVESSYHGSALLYRLLEGYPTDRLLVVETGPVLSVEHRRLYGRKYIQTSDVFSRLSRSRFNKWYNLLKLIFASNLNRRLAAQVRSFGPELVLTVAHGASWSSAGRIAKMFGIPLYLVCHDDWPSLAPFPNIFRRWLNLRFNAIYRQAEFRFCVSPAMVEEYERRYGVEGTLLYPSRASNAVKFDGVPTPSPRKLTVAFAGSQFLREDFALMSSALTEFGGELVVFGPFSEEDMSAGGLTAQNIRIGGMLDSNRMIDELRREADILFVPVSFDENAWQFSAYSFPSKLADYTQAGLPLLILGPSGSSVVRWAHENSGVGVCVTEKSRGAVVRALSQLLSVEERMRCGFAALTAGEKYFSHAAAERVFIKAILK